MTQGVDLAQHKFLEWTEDLETQVASLTRDHDATRALRTERYWQIHALTAASPRGIPVISHEIDEQTETLKRWSDELRARVTRLAATTGQARVLDTNVLLQYLPFDQVPWTRVLDASEVRLIVPLRVVEELDAKKYSDGKRLSSRARALLPMLEATLGIAGAPGMLQPGVTIEVPVEPDTRIRPEDADEEILQLCLDLEQYGGAKAKLVTADTGMRLRARALSVGTVAIPDRYLRTRDGE